MAAYSITPASDDCYPGTSVLINRLGLREQPLLDQAEELAVSVQSARIYESAGDDRFTFAYYRALHHALFTALYDWAGELRTINISKKGTAFCPAQELSDVGEALFARLVDADEFVGLGRGRFIRAVAEFYHDLNMLHPFREGNGRTQRLFFTLLIERAGYHIDFSAQDTDELMLATIYAAQGVMDHLIRYFEKAVY